MYLYRPGGWDALTFCKQLRLSGSDRVSERPRLADSNGNGIRASMIKFCVTRLSNTIGAFTVRDRPIGRALRFMTKLQQGLLWHGADLKVVKSNL